MTSDFSTRRCPLCHTHLVRTRRTSADRLLSTFLPVERRRCASCSWESRIFKFTAAQRRAMLSALLIVTTFVVGLLLALHLAEGS